jgi:chorismate mutase
LREQVDRLDEQVLDLLSKRMDVVRKMGKVKAQQNVSTLQPNRWLEIVKDRVSKGAKLDLSEDFVLQLMQSIHEEAIRLQEQDRLG